MFSGPKVFSGPDQKHIHMYMTHIFRLKLKKVSGWSPFGAYWDPFRVHLACWRAGGGDPILTLNDEKRQVL